MQLPVTHQALDRYFPELSEARRNYLTYKSVWAFPWWADKAWAIPADAVAITVAGTPGMIGDFIGGASVTVAGKASILGQAIGGSSDTIADAAEASAGEFNNAFSDAFS